MGDPPAQSAPPLPPIDLEDAARRLGGWFGQPLHDLHRPSGNGYSNETLIGFLENGEGVVVRLGPARAGVFRDYDLSLQYDCMDIARQHGVPVPPLVGREDDPGVLGRPFYVMGAVEGRVPSDNPPYTFEGSWVLDLDPAGQRALEDNGLDTLAAIHRVPRSAWEGALAGRVPVGLDALLDHWEGLLRWAAEGRPQPVAERGLGWLRTHRPEVTEAEPALCWGDARIGNIIFGDDLHPAAVLDWEMASIGDPVVDLAWWLALERHFAPVLGMPPPPGFPSRQEQVERWELATGRRAEHVGYYEVLAGFRYSVVMIRVARLMIADGLLPPDSDFESDNTATATLEAVLAEVGG